MSDGGAAGDQERDEHGSSIAWRHAGAEGCTVLVVEDNPDHRYVYTHVLRLAGYTVTEADSGDAGLRCAVESQPDIIVLDIGLPTIDGWEVARALKKDARTHDIPIIAVTVHAFEQDRERSLEAGCAEHLEKPATPMDVLHVVNRVWDERRPSSAAPRTAD